MAPAGQGGAGATSGLPIAGGIRRGVTAKLDWEILFPLRLFPRAKEVV